MYSSANVKTKRNFSANTPARVTHNRTYSAVNCVNETITSRNDENCTASRKPLLRAQAHVAKKKEIQTLGIIASTARRILLGRRGRTFLSHFRRVNYSFLAGTQRRLHRYATCTSVHPDCDSFVAVAGFPSLCTVCVAMAAMVKR